MRMRRFAVAAAILISILTAGLLLGGSLPNVGTGQWTPASDMSDARDGAAAVQLQSGSILITGGSNSAGPLQSADIYETDGTLIAAAPMQSARSGHSATVLQDGRVLVAGGSTGVGTATNAAEIYDPTANAWSSAGALSNARYGHTATLLNDGRVAIIGGQAAGSPVTAIEIYDPVANSFSTAASLNTPRTSHAAAELADGRVLVSGGFGTDGNGNPIALSSVEIFDPVAGTVSTAAAMNVARGNHGATTVLDGLVVVTGGSDGTNDLNSIETYNATANTWTVSAATLSVPRSGHQATLLPVNNSVLVSGGSSAGSPVLNADDYQPWTDTVVSGGAMNAPRVAGAGSGLGVEGLYLAAGGSGGKSTELHRFATVKTDQSDYAPGTPVLMTGTGYAANETVDLNLKQDDGDPNTDTMVQADGSGNISYQGFAPNIGDIGTHFHLTAIGQTSGFQAQTTFTDANIKVFSAPSGTSFTLSFKTFNNTTNCTGTPTNNSTQGILPNQQGNNGNLGVGNPHSVELQAPAVSDQGTAFQNWSWTGVAAPEQVATVGSTTPVTSPTTTNPICVEATSGSVGAGTFTATYATVVPAPTLTTSSPSSGDLNQTLTNVMLTGSNFANDATVAIGGTGVTLGTVTVNSSTQITISTVTINGVAGTLGGHSVTVTNPVPTGFTGGGSSSQTFTVNKRTTSTSVSCTPTSVSVGSPTSCTATVTDNDTGTAITPSGGVSFTSSGTGNFSPTSCTVSGSGATATCSVNYTPTVFGTGTHTITGNYGGDATHSASNGTFNETILQPPSISKTFGAASIPVGGSTSLSFTISNPNTGTALTGVAFTDTLPSGLKVSTPNGLTGSCGGGTITATAGSGSISLSAAALAASGSCSFSVNVTGATPGLQNNLTSSVTSTNGGTGNAAAASITVNKDDTTTSTTSSQNPSVFGQLVTFTATVSPIAPGTGTPTGSVNFNDGAIVLAMNQTLTGGQASFSTSSLSIAPKSWSQLSPTGTAPPGNMCSAYAEDGNGNLIVYGQPACSGPAGVWVLSHANGLGGAPTWTKLSPTGSTPNRHGATVVYDPSTNALILFGGCVGGCLPVANDVWVLSNANGTGGTPNWTQLSPTGGPPTPRQGGTAVYDPNSNRMIIFAGQDGGGSACSNFSDTWVLTNANGTGGTPAWTQLSATGGPPDGRYTATSFYDPANKRMTVMGGFSGGGGCSLTNSVWVLSNADGTGGAPAWTNTIANGSAGAPAAVQSWPAAFDAIRDRGLVHEAGTRNVWAITNGNGLGGPSTWVSMNPNGGFSGTGVLGFGYDAANNVMSAVSQNPDAWTWEPSHIITSTYNGDTTFNATNSDAASIAANLVQYVNQGTTTTSVSSSENPSNFGDSVTFTATVAAVSPAAGNPTGTVTFEDNGTPIGSGTLSTTAGVTTATFSTSTLTVGTHPITAVYGGDLDFSGSTSALSQVVKSVATTTAIMLTPNTVVVGQSSSVSVTVTSVGGGPTPAGTISFSSTDGTDVFSPSTCTLSGGTCSVNVTAHEVGISPHTIAATYTPSDSHTGSSNTALLAVNKSDTTTTITANTPNPSVVGQAVNISASVAAKSPGSGTPTGSVTVNDGVGQTCTITLSSGSGSCSLTPVAAGTDTLNAQYNGDNNFNTSASAGVSQTVNKADTTTTITANTPNPSVVNQAVSISTSVSVNSPGVGTPTGTVTVSDGVGETCTITLVSGSGSCSLTPQAAGTDTLTAHYNGDANFNNSTSAGVSQTVKTRQTTTTVTLSPSTVVVNQSTNVTVTVTDTDPAGTPLTPTGTIVLTNSGSELFSGPCALSGSGATATCSVTLTPSAAGNHTIGATFAATSVHSTSSDSKTLTVNTRHTTTTVSFAPNPVVVNQSSIVTVTVKDDDPFGSFVTPSGTITLGSNVVSDGFSSNTCSLSGVGNVSSCQVTVTPQTASPTLHGISASYPSDAVHTGSSDTENLTVNTRHTTTTVSFSLNPVKDGESTTVTATVTDDDSNGTAVTPAGTVTIGSSVVSDVLSSTTCTLSGSGAVATCTVTLTPSMVVGGSHVITASYPADGVHSASTGNSTLTVQKADTTTAVATSSGTITLGDTVTFTATVTVNPPGAGTPTGLVTFFDGATPLGSGTLNGVVGNDQATFSTSLLSAAGSPHSITAAYDSDGNFNPSTSASISETVNPRTSTTGVILAPITVVVGQPSTATVTVTDSGSIPPGTADTFTTTGAPATGRTGFTSTLFADGLVLVAGGTDASNNVLNSAEIYSVSGAGFSSTGNLNSARTLAVSALLPNGKVLIAGGTGDGSAAGALNTAELFDPTTGTFTSTSHNMTVARVFTTAVLLNTGKVLIAGGQNSGGAVNSAELYDPATDTFTATGNLNTARLGPSATLLGTGKVLVAGGFNSSQHDLNTAELFDPAGNAGAGTFTLVAGANPTLSTGRFDPQAALLPNGMVLVAGGANAGGAVTSADLYDPVADSFTASAGQMSQARAGGFAITMPNAMVLLLGGTTSQAVDLYDAESDKFDSTGSLQQSDQGLNFGLVATLLNNGRVLAIGLTTGGSPDAELYSPSFNPLGTVGVTSSEATDGITGACMLTPSTSTASTCTSTITPVNVATSPHTITGNFPADAVHSGSSNTASLTVNKADTSTTVVSSVNPSVFGQSVTFTATVAPVPPGAGTPTGTVTFFDGGSPIGSGTLGIGGQATFTTSALAVGNHTITANYGGDANYNTSTGSLTGNPQVVNKADTSTTLTSSLNPSVFGQSVTFTATVSAVAPGAGTPTGTVTFLDGGNPIGVGTLSAGVATFTTSALNAGSHTITTTYGGDGNFNGSNGSLTGNPQVVNKADTSTAVTSSVNPSVFGQSVTFTATVSAVAPGAGTPTGTVTFLDGGSPIGTGTLSGGIATFATSALAVGNHTITTSYGGDPNFNGSNGSLTGNPQVVNKANTSTAVTSSVNPSVFGQSVTFTATITAVAPGAGTPTGTVTFLDGGSPIGTGTLSGGVATFATSALAVGSHTITTTYGGDPNFNVSNGSLTGNPQVVNKANTATTVTSSVNPSVFGQSVTFTATVTAVAPGAGTPTGSVNFFADGNPIGTGTLTGGVTTIATSVLAVGSHTITTSYGGDGNFNGSNGSLTGNPQVVNKANTATTLTSSANPSTLGQGVTFTATISPVAPGAGVPTGTVNFFDNGNPIGSPALVSGVASVTTSSLTVGSHNITTTYAGDGNFNGSNGSLTQQVNFNFLGFQAPYAPPPTTFNVKRTMPLKWQYTNSSGAVVNSSAANPVISITGPYACGGNDNAGSITVNDAGSSGYQYDPTTNTWQFNWQIKGNQPGCYNIFVTSQQSGQTNGPLTISVVNQ